MKPNTKFLESIKDKRIVFSPYMLAAEVSRLLNVFLENEKMLHELLKFKQSDLELFCDAYAIDYVKVIYDKNMKSKPNDPEEIQ